METEIDEEKNDHGWYLIASTGTGACADGHIFDRTGRNFPADGTICVCRRTMFVAKDYHHSVVDVQEMAQALLLGVAA